MIGIEGDLNQGAGALCIYLCAKIKQTTYQFTNSILRLFIIIIIIIISLTN